MLSRHDSGRTLQWICHRAGSAIVGIAVAFAPQWARAQPAAFDLDVLAARGGVLVQQDRLVAEMRSMLPDDSARRGFDIGLAAAEGQTLPGPGKQRIHDSLPRAQQEGYATAVIYSLARNRLAAPQAGAVDNPALAAEAVDAHNKVRAEAVPPPVPALLPMQWSTTAAVVAQGWADHCQFMHNPQRGSLGENLYASVTKTAISAAVAEWANESAAYDYGDNSCNTQGNGNSCAHYTQIVWRNSVGLGCAMKNCATGSPFGGSGTWQLWICNYSPPGNVLGERPY